MKTIFLKRVALGLLFSLSAFNLSAQDTDKGGDHALKQANNPLANVKALNFQDYYATSLFGEKDANANQFFMRYAQPIGKVLMRASLPVATFSADEIYKSGLGDMQIFGAYLFSDDNAKVQLGAGPLLVLPTGTSSMGAKKWQAGLSFIAFAGTDPQFQYGALLTWQMSFAGSGKEDINSMGIQPFLMWQLGGGTYLRSTPLVSVNFEKSGANVPMGLGIGKVVKVRSTVFNLFLEPQYSVYNRKMDRAAKFQVFTGINLQFM